MNTLFKVRGLSNVKFWGVSLGVFCAFFPCSAQDFYKGKAQGWHWYEDRVKEESEEPKKTFSAPRHSLPLKPLTPTRKIEAYKKDLEEKLHRALVYPTPQNLIAYMEAQARGQDMAQKFSDEWMKVIYTHPHLDYNAKAPVNHVGQQIHSRQEEKRRTEKLKRLAQTHGLFFFFRSDCELCHAFASVVKSFSQTYGFRVLAISMDGRGIDGFPEFERDNGISSTFNIRQVPTLLAVDPHQRQVIPLSHGFISQSEIEKRADALVRIVNASAERKRP